MLDTIRTVAGPILGEPTEGGPIDSAHVGLIYWGGRGRIPRRELLLVTEGSRETQLDLDVQGVEALIHALTEAHQQLAEGHRSGRQARRLRSIMRVCQLTCK